MRRKNSDHAVAGRNTGGGRAVPLRSRPRWFDRGRDRERLELGIFGDHLALLATSLVVAFVVTGVVDRFAIPAKTRRASLPPAEALGRPADFSADSVVLLVLCFFCYLVAPDLHARGYRQHFRDLHR